MRFRHKIVGRVGAVVAATVLMLAAYAAPAHADSAWGEIRPAFSGFLSGVFTNPKCLGIYGPDGFSNDNARVVQWDCNGNNDQQWSSHFYGYDSSGIYPLIQIINLRSGKCMEVRNWGAANGTQVDQYTCLNGPSTDSMVSKQLWFINLYGGSGVGNYYTLQPWSASTLANMCLDVYNSDNSNGAKVEQWSCNYNLNQQFWGPSVFGS